MNAMATKFPKWFRDLAEQESAEYISKTFPEKLRRKRGLVFTPTSLVCDMLEAVPADGWEQGKTWLEPCCGNGQFVAVVLRAKIKLYHQEPTEALATTYANDLLKSNILSCRQRVLNIVGDTPLHRLMVEDNIKQSDFLASNFTQKFHRW